MAYQLNGKPFFINILLYNCKKKPVEMSVINIYNRNIDEHVGEHCYYCGRGSALGNPYTHINDKKTKALYICKSRDEAIESYRHYFDCMYGTDAEFTNMFDKIYG